MMLTVDFINVGYGDSILLRYMGNNEELYTILVDGGKGEDCYYQESKTKIKSVDYLLHESISKIDLLIITHLHDDHVGGLVPIVEKLPVKEVWINTKFPKKLYGLKVKGGENLSEGARNVLESINALSSILSIMHKNGTIIRQIQEDVGAFRIVDNLKLTVYTGKWESYIRQDEIIQSVLVDMDNIETLLVELFELSNSVSIPVQVDYYSKSVLLGADVAAEFWIDKKISKSHILKIPHHGRDDSMTPGLAKILSPEYVVVSVADSHLDELPSPKAVAALLSNEQPPEILCTDEVEIRNYSLPTAQRAIRFRISEDGLINKELVLF